MAADSTQPGPGASPTDTLVHGAKTLPGPHGQGRRCCPRAAVLPGVCLPPIHTCNTLQVLCLKTEMFFKFGPYHKNRWRQPGSPDYY